MVVAFESIRPDDPLFRRIRRVHIVDGRVHRTAYYVRGGPDAHASADLARLTSPDASAARGKQGTGVGVVLAEAAISQGLAVRHDPEPDWYPHSLIEVITSKQHCILLAEATEVVLNPTA